MEGLEGRETVGSGLEGLVIAGVCLEGCMLVGGGLEGGGLIGGGLVATGCWLPIGPGLKVPPRFNSGWLRCESEFVELKAPWNNTCKAVTAVMMVVSPVITADGT